MEFIEGITVCSDCGGPLVESKEVADAMRLKEQKEREAAAAAAAAAYAQALSLDPDQSDMGDADPAEASAVQEAVRAVRQAPHVYVKKSQQYDDFKSAAVAFYLVGGVALAVSVLGWTGILPLPMTGFSRILSLGMFTCIGIGSLGVAISSSRSAKSVRGQIDAEEATTKELTDWFVNTYTAGQIDDQIRHDYGDLSPEEQALKRFDLIQDLIITSHDLPDQAYVDLLAEDIYGKLFEN